MNSTGRYIVRYEPSDSQHEYLQTTIEMSISDEASLEDMANFFDSFLKAATYVYDGSLKVVENKPKPNPYSKWESVGSVTSFAHRYGDTVITGGSSTDTISFGAAQPAMEFGARSYDDVFTFG